jgi:hypothetical protein
VPPRKTTVILVLLATDNKTSLDNIDPMLKQIQQGVDDWFSCRSIKPLDVFCMYHRRSKSGAETKHFRIEKDTLTSSFCGNELDLSKYKPTLLGDPLTGPLAEQLEKFCRQILQQSSQRHENGPIRIVFGAHGNPSQGLSGEEKKLLYLLMRSNHLDPLLRRLSLRQRFEILRNHILGFSPHPAGISGSVKSKKPDLTLDDAANALKLFPSHRLQSLLIHTCFLSSIETICALDVVRHQIGCQSDLNGYLRMRDWFPVLASPFAQPEEVTKACFAGITTTENGYFSSHWTASSRLLRALDALGGQFFNLMKSCSADAFEKALSCARVDSASVQHSSDLGTLVARLSTCDLITPKKHLLAIAKEIIRLQLEPVLRAWDSWATSIPTDDFLGINVFLPERGGGICKPPPVSELPDAFKARAPKWCEFLDLWMT